MNHLAHFKVSYPEPGLVIGGFLGDYIKGPLTGKLPDSLERGVRLHRAVDAFADGHETTRTSISRFDPQFRRVGSIMVDIIYDYFLAKRWSSFHDEPLEAFSESVFSLITECGELPETARETATRMHQFRSLTHYGSDDYVRRSFSHLGARLSRSNPLDLAFPEFKHHEQELARDFEVFFPELVSFADDWQVKH